MKPRLRRVFRWLVASSVLLVLTLFAGVWVLLSTERGMTFVWGFVEPRLPSSVAVEGVAGRLRGPLELRGLALSNEQMDVAVSSIVVDWSLASLRRRTLDIGEVAIDGVRVGLSASVDDGEPPSQEPLPDIELPIALELARLIVRDVEVVPAGADASPILLDSISIADLSFVRELTLGSLAVVGPDVDVELAGQVQPQASYPFSVEANWELIHPELGAIDGGLEASGDLDAISVDAGLRRPVDVGLLATLGDPMGHRIVDGDITVAETNFAAVLPEGPPGSLEGTVRMSGAVDSLRAVVSARIETPMTGPASIDATLLRKAEAILVERASVELGRTRLQAQGSVLLAEEGPEADLILGWTEFQWPLQGDPQIVSASGDIRLHGPVSDFQARATARVASGDLPPADIGLRGRGSQERFAIDELVVEALEGALRVEGQVAWSPELAWDVGFAAEDLQSQDVLPDTSSWHGQLSFAGRARGRATPSVAEIDLALDTLWGQVRAAPIVGSASGFAAIPLGEDGPDLDRVDLSMRQLELGWGSAQVSASGTASDSLDLEILFSVPDLGLASPDFSGFLEGRSRVFGSRDEPGIEVSLAAGDVVAESRRVSEVSLSGLVETVPGGDVEIQARISELELGEQAIDSVVVRVAGILEDHEVSAGVRAEAGEVVLRAAGGVAERRWTGTLNGLDISVDPMGSWHLSNPVMASLSPDGAELGLACWRSDLARLCLEGRWQSEGPSAVQLTIRDLTADRFQAFLPEGWSAEGSLGADIAGTLPSDGSPTASISAEISSGLLRYPTPAGPQELAGVEATLEGGLDPQGAYARFAAGTATAVDGTRIVVSSDVALPDFTGDGETIRSQTLEGSITARINDFSAVQAVAPDLGPVAGELSADVSISGTVESLQLVGEARFFGGSLDLPRAGLELRSIEMIARGRGSEGIALEGGLQSGSGRLSIEGEVPVSPTVEAPARFILRGSRVQAVALPEVEVWVSPDLEVSAAPEAIRVTGEMGIPVTRVELSEIPASAVRASPDVVFVGDSLSGSGPVPDLALSVRVILGDSVSFQGFGFSAQPTGSLLVSSGPGGATTGTGEIALTNGRYRAYGQDLTMERGRILFAGGPVENPGLDIRASRTARDGVVAGLQVDGTLRRPEVSLFSEPPMMESEALAYIVLGRPLGTASTSEGNQVANAAASIGIRGGNVLANRIGQRFGLSDVQVEADDGVEEASLVAGKYLSPRLYVSYGVGLFEPISTFRLRYLLSSRWTLTAESGRAAGADLLYQIERGR